MTIEDDAATETLIGFVTNISAENVKSCAHTRWASALHCFRDAGVKRCPANRFSVRGGYGLAVPLSGHVQQRGDGAPNRWTIS